MGIFKRNPNETGYVGGKKHWVDVIKNTAPGGFLIWRQPEEDFNTNSTLVVMPGEAAIFVSQGEIEAVFDEPGTYQLSTQNYPFITRLKTTLFSGGISTFNCVVYFVSLTDSEQMLWGTQSRITLRDKFWEILTSVGARGAYRFRVEKPEVFLTRLIGSRRPFNSTADIDNYFSEEFQGKIRSMISIFLQALQTELIGLDAYLEDIAASIEPGVDRVLSEYGLRCVRFVISGLDVDTTKYDLIDQSLLAKIDARRKAEAMKQEIEVLGKDWTRFTGKEILEGIANNTGGAGAMAGAGFGFGMGNQVGSMFGSLWNETFRPVGSEPPTPNVNPIIDGHDPFKSNVTPSGFDTDRFAVEDSPAEDAVKPAENNPAGGQSTKASRLERLKEIKEFFDMGLITEADFEKKKAEILSEV